MKSHTLYDDGERQWVVFGRDPGRGEEVVDTNQYLVVHRGRALLVDPGGAEIFPPFVAALSAHVEPAALEAIFASHQDPDIISSLSLWLDLAPGLPCHAPSTWSGFLPHLGGGQRATLVPVPDEGGPLPLGSSADLRMVPAHYCHASGHLTLYDPRARILFSSDIGAALLPPDQAPGFFVEDFAAHVRFMEGFHRRWMPSNRAKNDWIHRVRQLDVELLCPQHGAIFKGDDVERFLDWFEALEVGTAVGREG